MTPTPHDGGEPLGLDHVGILGTDLSRMREAFTRLGFAPTEPRALLQENPVDGKVASLDQQSCHIVFERGYVELSSLTAARPTHHLASYARRYEGLHILALGTANLEDLVGRLRKTEIAALEPAQAAREVSYGARAGTARFKWFMLAPAVAPEALICVVQHLTPEIVFQPEVQRHPNGACGLVGATFVVVDPTATASLLGALTGAPATGGPEALELVLPGGTLSIQSAAEFAQRFPGVAVPPLPCLAAMTLRFRDLSRMADHCRGAGVRLERSAHRWWVDPRFAAGAVIECIG